MKKPRYTIAYFGDEGSHTFAAASSLPADEYLGCATMAEIAAHVRSGRAALGVVPIENSSGGTVGETLDMLADAGVYITGQRTIPIRHMLVGLPGAKTDTIQTVYSHPQALLQCDGFIKDHLAAAALVPVRSTSAALQILQNPTQAAIARVALEGQTVLVDGIEDKKDNMTRFILLKPEPELTGKTVSIIFQAKHEIGALNRVLQVFADYGVNLTKLESRPNKQSAFSYRFYVELETDADKSGLMRLLGALGEATSVFRFLGRYE